MSLNIITKIAGELPQLGIKYIRVGKFVNLNQSCHFIVEVVQDRPTVTMDHS